MISIALKPDTFVGVLYHLRGDKKSLRVFIVNIIRLPVKQMFIIRLTFI